MGKNYAENSLKHYLKQKVRITLGLVVTFLITGAVAFALPTINGEHHLNDWIGEVEENKSFGNILDKEIKIERTDNGKDKSIIISKTYNDTLGDILVINLKNSQEGTDKFEDIKLGISLKYLSNDTFEYVKTSLNNISNAVSSGKINESQLECKELLEILNSEITDKKNKYNGYYTAQLADKTEVENTGIIMKDTSYDEKTLNVGQTAVNGGTVKNSGIIMNEGRIGQYARGENSKAYNYGLISNIDKETGTGDDKYGNLTGGAGQKAYDNAEVYNYGIIAKNFKSGQWADKNSKAYNYGLIFNERKFAQKAGEGSSVYNFGTLVSNLFHDADKKDNADFGSDMQVAMGGSVYNYGMIHTNRMYTQITRGDNSNLYNYGIMNSSYTQLVSITHNNSKGYNYGIINGTSGKAPNNKASSLITITNNSEYKNYGLINDNGTLSAITAKKDTDVINYGIIIANNNIFNEGYTDGWALNYGIGLKRTDGKLELHTQIIDETANADFNGNGQKDEEYSVNYETYDLTANKTITEIENDSSITVANQKNNIFVNNLGKDSNVTLTTDKEKLENKHITAVFGKESQADTAIKANDDLTVKDTSIVGYFEKEGTLLNVNGDLTLEGNSVINAITGNEYTGYTGEELKDVVAVKLADNGTLTIGENSKVLGAVKGNGVIVYENSKEEHLNSQDVDSIKIETTANDTTNIYLANVKITNMNNFDNASGKLVIDNKSDKKLEGKNVSTSITLANNINIQNGIDGSSSANGIELILGDGHTSYDETIKIGGEVLLGQADDTIIINNILGKYEDKAAVINGNGGDDTVNLKNSNGKHDTFDYQLKNIETLDLGNSSWKIGENAGISHGEITKADEKTEIKNGTLLGELTGNTESTDFINSKNVNNILENSSFGENAEFQIGVGKNMKLEAGAEYNINDDTAANLEKIKDNVTASAIFTEATEQGKDIRVKSAEEMNIDERYSGIYNEMLENASSNEEILNVLNNSSASEIADTINSKGALGDTLATTGYKITRDITNSFMSAVNEWDKKANKGEWLANAKYISSDVEYDGANNVKGYDSDINSMVGMIEYGVSENTSYGIALGGGDTEVDIKGAGTLEGDNYYIGAYAKHSVNGFDLVGNLGYTISDLDVDGKGSADSSAVTLGGYIKKDIALTETVRLEPNFAFTYDYIMQDNAEGNGVKVNNKDIHVFEATVGMNIVKGFNIEKGILELKTGVKYSMADINRNEETVISVYGIDDINLGNPEVDKTRGTARVGFDYEHETGFGVNGKYEMMWSDSGDDSRITAGVSYKF